MENLVYEVRFWIYIVGFLSIIGVELWKSSFWPW